MHPVSCDCAWQANCDKDAYVNQWFDLATGNLWLSRPQRSASWKLHSRPIFGITELAVGLLTIALSALPLPNSQPKEVIPNQTRGSSMAPSNSPQNSQTKIPPKNVGRCSELGSCRRASGTKDTWPGGQTISHLPLLGPLGQGLQNANADTKHETLGCALLSSLGLINHASHWKSEGASKQTPKFFMLGVALKAHLSQLAPQKRRKPSLAQAHGFFGEPSPGAARRPRALAAALRLRPRAEAHETKTSTS